MSDRVDQLEYTVMELGTEVFRLKSQISDISSVQEKTAKTLKNLKDILDEKGVISEDDFAAASSSEAETLEEHERFDLQAGPSNDKPEFH